MNPMDTSQGLNRDKSVKFVLRWLNRKISHQNVIDSLREKDIDVSTVYAIQITTTNCVITFKDDESKTKIVNEGLSILGLHVNPVEVNKNITNVKIVDAPIEMSNDLICSFVSKYGEFMNGSMKMGRIKGTDVFTGTRCICN